MVILASGLIVLAVGLGISKIVFSSQSPQDEITATPEVSTAPPSPIASSPVELDDEASEESTIPTTVQTTAPEATPTPTEEAISTEMPTPVIQSTSPETSTPATSEAEAPASEMDIFEEKLEAELESLISGLDSKWDVVVQSLGKSPSESFYAHVGTNIDTNEKMVSASLIKIFIMGAVYDKVNDGIIDEETVTADLYSMITISDNSATNRLITLLGSDDSAVGMSVVNDFAKELACNNVELNRLMLENNGLQNYVTADDCATLLRHIYSGTCVSTEYSTKMMDLLSAQTVAHKLPAQLPSGTELAHKTGEIIGICSGDVGIVFSPKGDYIISVICNNPVNDADVNTLIATISLNIYNLINE